MQRSIPRIILETIATAAMIFFPDRRRGRPGQRATMPIPITKITNRIAGASMTLPRVQDRIPGLLFRDEFGGSGNGFVLALVGLFVDMTLICEHMRQL
jgi:hypothetical protein